MEVNATAAGEAPAFQTDLEENKVEEESVACTPSNPKATEQRMKEEELMTVATSPKMRELHRAKELKEQLKIETRTRAENEFKLNTELFSIQFHAYRDSGKPVDTLLSTFKQISAAGQEKRESLIASLGKEEKELYDIYNSLISGAHLVATAPFTPYSPSNSTDELCEYYFLQILRLEKSLNFPVCGNTLIELELDSLYIRIRKLSEHKASRLVPLENETKFYWQVFVEGLFKCLTFDEGVVEEPFIQETLIMLLILHSIFDESLVDMFPYRKYAANPIEQFFPYVVKYDNLKFMKDRFNDVEKETLPWERAFKWVTLHEKAAELMEDAAPQKAQRYRIRAAVLREEVCEQLCSFSMFDEVRGKSEDIKERFDEFHTSSPKWDKAFEWVKLHVKIAEFLAATNPEKAKEYLQKAKDLTTKTLWSYPFFVNRTLWMEKEKKALALIAEVESRCTFEKTQNGAIVG